MPPILALALAATPQAIGIYDGWGAFRDAARCYAIAQPVSGSAAARMGAYASVSTWPRRGIRNQISVRLSRAARDGAPMTLSIDERRFDLVVRGDRAWAPDRETDAAIVGAMRSGRSMSIEGVSANGRAFADVYALPGAATAIDAAALECLG
ncbi:hypothetical protein ACFO8O_08935 [Hephaestia sp. GCM10023244]|uniref:hypothetical protein n=1 Tax=unclassified Hephaestia TaxID=2631281 RepID=UPI00207787D5|nr:hypothetical protein [Hephaestia sp. MAHUQ-44]MCM8731082.1 hypothetical protein [Hephaestia sp. MAHUQ-44]